MGMLHFKKVNEEQSEVWRDGQDHRLISNEGIRLAVKQLCDPVVYEKFASTYPGVGEETSLDDPNSEGLAMQFEIR
jgi:hypothetical protein